VFLITAFASPAPTPLRPLPAFARTHLAHARPTECATREVIRSTHTSGCARPQDPLGVTSNPKVADKRSRKVSERCLTRTIIEEFNSEVHRLESPKVSETSASARPDCARAASLCRRYPTLLRTRAPHPHLHAGHPRSMHVVIEARACPSAPDAQAAAPFDLTNLRRSSCKHWCMGGRAKRPSRSVLSRCLLLVRERAHCLCSRDPFSS